MKLIFFLMHNKSLLKFKYTSFYKVEGKFINNGAFNSKVT